MLLLRSDATAQPLNSPLHIASNRGVVLLPYNRIPILASGLVQIVHRRQACGSAQHQLERAIRRSGAVRLTFVCLAFGILYPGSLSSFRNLC